MTTNHRRAIAGAFVAVIAVFAVILIATSGGGGALPAGHTGPPASLRALKGGAPAGGLPPAAADCLKQHGVQPTEALQHQVTPDSQMMHAFRACQQYLRR